MSREPEQGEHSTGPARERRPLFTLIALLIPLGLFAFVELALRVGGFGREHPLFVPSPAQPQYLQASPNVVQRFFARPADAPSVNIETAYFRAEKAPGTLRIFVQGGSSAAGFPYGYGASLAGMLEQRLRRALTGRPIEVISTAMAAVNSYALLDFADEIIAQQPDAVLIYAGHNEYLGILGVGSALSSSTSPTITRLVLALRGLRLYQFIESAYAGMRPAPDSAAQTQGGTLMARIAREKAIPLDSSLFDSGVEQFRTNMSKLLAKYQRAGIPVFLGTLASNERDQTPFVSRLAADTDREAWQTRLAGGRAALEDGRLDEAARAFSEAVAEDDGSAEAWFLHAQALERQGRRDEARAAYLAAKDRDQLRFRAPELFNEIVDELAARYGATRVDVQGAMLAASEDGVIGSNLMLEHLHPNLDGYFLFADAYFDALLDTGLLGDSVQVLEDAQARRDIPVSEADRLFGEYKVKRIVSDWPFQVPATEPVLPAPTSVPEQLAGEMYRQRVSWPQAMARLQQHYNEQGDQVEYTRVALILADALPFAVQPQYSAGTALIRAQRPAEAVRYLSRVASLSPKDVNGLLALSHALILSGNLEPARSSLARVLELDPGNVTATNALAQLETIEARKRNGG